MYLAAVGQMGGVKCWSDGSLQGYTGFLSSPYHKVEEAGYDACYCGYAYREQPDLEELVEDVVKNGYQMSIHANGDQAINNTVRRYFLASLRFLSRQSEKHR